MKKLIIASLFLVIGTSSITLAQESTSFKKFNYGVRLISEFDFLPTFYIPKNNNPTYEINMKPESYIIMAWVLICALILIKCSSSSLE